MEFLTFLCYLFVIGVFIGAIGVKAYHKMEFVNLSEQLSEFFDNTLTTAPCKCCDWKRLQDIHDNYGKTIRAYQDKQRKITKEMDTINAYLMKNPDQRLYLRVKGQYGWQYIEAGNSSDKGILEKLDPSLKIA